MKLLKKSALGYSKPIRTPKREQAHIVAEKEKKRQLRGSKADSPDDVLKRKLEREQHRNNVKPPK